jgi:ribosomal protein L21E
MSNKKNIRQGGKIQLSKYFQKLSPGERVSVVKEKSLNSNFPKRLQGRSGVVEGKKGRIYVIKIKDNEKEKKYLIEAIHLKKIK